MALRQRIFWATLFGLIFFICYYGGAYVAASRGWALNCYFNWELRIPLFPQAIVGYVSVYLLIALTFVCVPVHALRNWGVAFFVCTLACSISFVALPCHLGFPRIPLEETGWKGLVGFLHHNDPPWSLFPSLHVAYAVLCTRALAVTADFYSYLFSRPMLIFIKNGLVFWLILICFSVLLVHQHHLIDVAGGLVLSTVVLAIGSRSFLKNQPLKELEIAVENAVTIATKKR